MKRFYPIFIYIYIFIILIIGVFTYQDYGIGIEEHFQRKSGFYWLNYILNFTNFDTLKESAYLKLEEIKIFTPRLFPIEKVPFYGVLFDVPLAFLEILFKIDDPQDYFYARHIAIFIIFLISAFCFYKIIEIRFKNLIISLFGFTVFLFSPRIYGNIFFDGKDIFFLSIITLNIFFLIKYLKKKNNLNLIIFSIFCAFSTSSRIIGILIPLSFLVILFLEFLPKNQFKIFLKKISIFIFVFFITLLSHWPYLWTLDINQLENFFQPFFFAMNPTVYFNGNFYQSKFLPISYIPLWITITTPLYVLSFFLFGIFQNIRRIFLRLISIDNEQTIVTSDFWRSDGEKFDLFIFVIFLSVTLLYLSINTALLSGWRHFYFLNFFIVFYSCYFTNYIILNYRKNNFKKFFFIILFFLSFITVYDIYKYHPFQSVYFNKFVSDKFKRNFEIDTISISRVHALNELLKEQGILNIGTASWTPLEDARSLIKKQEWSRLNFVGRDFKNADYIYTNFYYEVNTNYNDKYLIPENFSLYKTLSIDGTRIYSIFKKQ